MKLLIAPELNNLPFLRLSLLKDLQGDLKTLAIREERKLERSLEKHGLFVPFFVWKTEDGEYFLLDGHQRRKVLIKSGLNEVLVPCVMVAAATLEEAKEKLLVISSQYGKISQGGFSSFSFDLLNIEQTISFDAIKFGTDYNRTVRDAKPNTERVGELVRKWGVKVGQTWSAGRHVMHCGNSWLWHLTHPELVVTDPPFDQSPARVVSTISRICDAAIVLAGDKLAFGMAQIWQMRLVFVWARRTPRSYPTPHMPILAHNLAVVITRSRDISHGWSRPSPDFSSVISTEMEFDDSLMGHGKSAELFVEMLRGFPQHLVGDPFMGTGASILACEHLGRDGIGVELDPATFSIALERWHEATGIMPTLIGG